ncbi:MAG: enoyl-CoA hydratase/isomerase family protein [Planctomycetota bacterium]|jgi:enoyl-CoA hydratase
MGYEKIQLEVRDRIAYLTVNRPDKLNALNEQVIGELTEAFLDLRDNPEAGVVILAGAGEKAFVAGADISQFPEMTPTTARKIARKGQHLTRLIETLGKPVICAVQGYALGGGCELAMACTIRIASEKAVFGQPEVKLGLIPGYGGTQRLPRLVGLGRAMEIILTGSNVKADEALRIGLVNRVVPPDQLMATAEKIANKILAVGPKAVEFALDVTGRGMEMPLAQALELEADGFARTATTQDMPEGTKAFLEKRKPDFKGK